MVPAWIQTNLLTKPQSTNIKDSELYKSAGNMWDLEVDWRLETKQANILMHSLPISIVLAAFTSTHTQTHTSVWLISLKIASSSGACCFSWMEADSWLCSSNKSPLMLWYTLQQCSLKPRQRRINYIWALSCNQKIYGNCIIIYFWLTGQYIVLFVFSRWI